MNPWRTFHSSLQPISIICFATLILPVYSLWSPRFSSPYVLCLEDSLVSPCLSDVWQTQAGAAGVQVRDARVPLECALTARHKGASIRDTPTQAGLSKAVGQVRIMSYLPLVLGGLCALGTRSATTSFQLYTCPHESPGLVPRRHTLSSLPMAAPGQGVSGAHKTQPGKDGVLAPSLHSSRSLLSDHSLRDSLCFKVQKECTTLH